MTKTHIVVMMTLALTLASSGCFLFNSTGESESIGSVHVEALLVADTCGPGSFVGGPSMSYDVEIQRNGDTLRWLGPGGAVQGTFTGDRTFCIELTDQWHVRDADPWYEDPGCDMQRIERLCGTLDLEEVVDEMGVTTEEVVGLTARHEAFVSGTPESQCPEMIGVNEGQYLALPCQVVYELVGSPGVE